jgi:UDP-N-acetyl-L-fucosamine synthase
MKVMTIVGTRPEVIKLSRVIAELDKHVDHVLVHTGQNYDKQLKDVFFEEMKIRRPDIQLNTNYSSNPIDVITNIMSEVDDVLERKKPDAVLILGDTNSCVAAAYAAKRRRTPIFHSEAGNRCFDERVPEEVNRRIVDHISDINMPYTEHARRNLLAEGIAADRIIKTGSPMQEVLMHYEHNIAHSQVLNTLGLRAGNYFVVSAHREENVDGFDRLRRFVRTVDHLAAKYTIPVVVTLHPRTRKRLGEAGLAFAPHVITHEPFGFFDYVQLQKYARCVLSDSGTITEESAIVGFPAVTLRQTHERPEGSDEGTLVMCDLDADKVEAAVRATHYPRIRALPADYQSAHVSTKVVRTILSYTDYVKRVVWRQS